MAIYYAQRACLAATGSYTDDARLLLATYSVPPYEVCPVGIDDVTINLRYDGQSGGSVVGYDATVASPDGALYAATVRDDRFLVVSSLSP